MIKVNEHQYETEHGKYCVQAWRDKKWTYFEIVTKKHFALFFWETTRIENYSNLQEANAVWDSTNERLWKLEGEMLEKETLEY